MEIALMGTQRIGKTSIKKVFFRKYLTIKVNLMIQLLKLKLYK